MWPRGDNSSGVGGDITSSRKSRSAGLSGFVQFMKRKDAENCVREMDGFDWGGSVLRVGWSKAVPLAPRALYGEQLRQLSRPHNPRTLSPADIQRERSQGAPQKMSDPTAAGALSHILDLVRDPAPRVGIETVAGQEIDMTGILTVIVNANVTGTMGHAVTLARAVIRTRVPPNPIVIIGIIQIDAAIVRTGATARPRDLPPGIA